MSRYRPPSAQASPYITRAGVARLRAELQRLWKIERPQVTAAVSEAAKNGDRSENGDYIYGKRRLREIDRRVRYLSKRLEALTVVEQLPADQHKVFFGAWCTVRDGENTITHVRVVGSDETDVHPEYISIDSPLARALLNRARGDEIEFHHNGAFRTLYIEDVVYEQDVED